MLFLLDPCNPLPLYFHSTTHLFGSSASGDNISTTIPAVNPNSAPTPMPNTAAPSFTPSPVDPSLPLRIPVAYSYPTTDQQTDASHPKYPTNSTRRFTPVPISQTNPPIIYRPPTTLKPTSKPTFKPTGKPSSLPRPPTTLKPTSKPTMKPTGKPSSLPTGQPSGTSRPPSENPTPSLTPFPVEAAIPTGQPSGTSRPPSENPTPSLTQFPVEAAISPGKSSSSFIKDCFSGSDTVTLESGLFKVLSEVVLGDRILTSDVAGDLSYSEVSDID
jgi:hypothetical protein